MDGCKVEELSDSSDEDIYTNAVAKVKAFKKKQSIMKPKKYEDTFFSSEDLPIEIKDNENFESEKESSLEPFISCNIGNNGLNTGVVQDDSSNCIIETIDVDLEITSVTKRRPVAQTNCIASITLDPDSEDSLIEVDASQNNALQFDNYKTEIKILWQSYKLVRLEICLHEPFLKVFEHFSKLQNVPIEQILLSRKDKRIKLTDTPDSLGLSVIDIIDGGVMGTEYVCDKSKGTDDSDENICKIKIQSSQKESISVSLRKNQPFQLAILQCATQLQVSETKIKLYIDGDLIDPSDTPESLEFEEEACIDLKVTS